LPAAISDAAKTEIPAICLIISLPFRDTPTFDKIEYACNDRAFTKTSQSRRRPQVHPLWALRCDKTD
jgi:hypothetical protein